MSDGAQSSLFVAAARAERRQNADDRRAPTTSEQPAGTASNRAPHPPASLLQDEAHNAPSQIFKREPWHLDAMRDELTDEIAFRIRVYERQVSERRMTPQARDFKIAVMRENLALIECLMREEAWLAGQVARGAEYIATPAASAILLRYWGNHPKLQPKEDHHGRS